VWGVGCGVWGVGCGVWGEGVGVVRRGVEVRCGWGWVLGGGCWEEGRGGGVGGGVEAGWGWCGGSSRLECMPLAPKTLSSTRARLDGRLGTRADGLTLGAASARTSRFVQAGPRPSPAAPRAPACLRFCLPSGTTRPTWLKPFWTVPWPEQQRWPLHRKWLSGWVGAGGRSGCAPEWPGRVAQFGDMGEGTDGGDGGT
jgi:hypothetical protein